MEAVRPGARQERFRPIDEAIAVTERDQPTLIHFEASLSIGVDPAALVDAAEGAVKRAPKAGWVAAPLSRGTRTLLWDTGASSTPSVDLVDSDDAFVAARSRLLSTPMPLDQGPLVRLLALLGPDGRVTRVTFVVHHALTDATGAVAFFLAVLSAAADTASPDLTVPVLGAGRSDEAPPETGGVWRAIRSVVRRPPQRLSGSPRGTESLAMVGVHLASVDLAGRRAAAERLGRSAGVTVTVNDLLLVAAHLTVERWNRDRLGARGASEVRVTVPLGGRRPGPALTSLGNYALQATTRSTSEQRRAVELLAMVIAAQTRAMKTDSGGSEPSALSDRISAVLPFRWRRALVRAVSLITRDGLLDSTRLSNLGVLSETAAELPLDGFWLTAPVRMPQGANIGVVSTATKIHVGIRSCPGFWSQADLDAFSRLFVDVLERL